MFLSDRIDCLIEELWQLAMTMASLKYIAGTVSQDWEATRAFIELDVDNKHLEESHRSSQVDKTEADSDKCLATDEIIASKEASTVKETATWTTSLKENEEKEEDNISMVAHQLPTLHISTESSEIVAHHIACNDITETSEIISMISHQISDDCKPVKTDFVDPVNNDEDDNSITLSMYAHETICIESAEESSGHQVSMVAHFQHRSEEDFMEQEGLISSMICHQMENMTDYCVDEAKQCDTISSGKHEILMSTTEEEPTVEFFSSMASHQLSFIATPFQLSEIPVTMVTHCIAKEQEYIIEDQDNVSMITHQSGSSSSNKENTIHLFTGAINLDHIPPMLENGEELSKQEVFPDEYQEEITEKKSLEHKKDEIVMVCQQSIEEVYYEEEIDKKKQEFGKDEIKYFPSMVVNQLQTIDIPLEAFESPMSMYTHVIPSNNTEETLETPDNASMVAHHIKKENGYLEYEIVNIKTSATDAEVTIVPGTNLFYTPGHVTSATLETSSDIPHQIKECKEEQIVESLKTNLLPCQETDHYSSYVTHQLSPLDNLHEFTEMPLSMVSHNIFKNIEVDIDVHDNISMVVHQNINNAIDCHENDSSEVCDMEDLEEYIDIHDILFISSLCSHETLHLETTTESSDSPLSMVSHHLFVPDDNPVDAVSMICHQSTVSSNIEQDDNKDIEYTAEVDGEVETEQNQLVTTMTAHQLQAIDIPSEFCVLPVSMATHVVMDQEFIFEDQDYETMLPHHINASNNIEIEELNEEVFLIEHDNISIPSTDHQLVFSEQKENTADKEHPGEEIEIHSDILDSYSVSSLKEQIIKPVLPQNNDLVLTSSMVTHQLPHCEIPLEFSQFLSSSASHGCFAMNQEELCLPTSMLTHQYSEQNCSMINVLGCIEEDKENEESEHTTSMASHQLPISNSDEEFFITALSHGRPTNELFSSENSGSESSMLGHLVSGKREEADNHSILDKDSISSNSLTKVNDDNQIKIDRAENTGDNSNKNLVEYSLNSYTEGTIEEKNEDSFQEESPVGLVYKNENNENSENIALKSPFTKRLTRIQKLQRLVEDEIEEFENKRKNNVKQIENDVETTETHIVNNVKNIQFQSCIVTHQKLNDEYNEDDIYESLNKYVSPNSTGYESLISSEESLNSVICTTSENFECQKEKCLPDFDETTQTNSDYEDDEESVIQASCTLEDKCPVVITSSQLPSAELKTEKESHMHEQEVVKMNNIDENSVKEEQCKQQTNEEFDDLKIQLRKTPRRSSNATTKIRETELLNSFLNEESKGTMEKCKKKPQKMKRKNSITLATLNESVKKQTYKIKFKVSLNTDSSKSSVLQYLFGCFGGEKLFHQQKQ